MGRKCLAVATSWLACCRYVCLSPQITVLMRLVGSSRSCCTHLATCFLCEVQQNGMLVAYRDLSNDLERAVIRIDSHSAMKTHLELRWIEGGRPKMHIVTHMRLPMSHTHKLRLARCRLQIVQSGVIVRISRSDAFVQVPYHCASRAV